MLPAFCDPEAETAAVVGLGAVVAAVVDDVSVLDVPPFTVGCTLNWGWTLMIGWKSITGAEIALETPLILMARPCDEWPWLAVCVCRPEAWLPVCVCWTELVWTCVCWWTVA